MRGRGLGTRHAATAALVVAVLFVCYLRQSEVAGVTSDGGSIALQAWDMLHGNVLLHGWNVADVSFYPTELPQYMLIESVFGLSPVVVHVAAAMTYTLLVLLVAAVAKGGARGTEGAARALLAGGIIVAPQLALTSTLLGPPDHIGSAVPVLLAWLVICHAERRPDGPGWLASVAVCAILAVSSAADALVLLTGIVPLIVACAVRLLRGRPASRWPALRLAAAAAGAAVLGFVIQWGVRALGGFHRQPVSTAITFGQLGHAVRVSAQDVLALFGADVVPAGSGAQLAAAVVHLAGVALVGWACCAAAVRLARGRLAADDELLVTGLLTGIVLNLAAYLFTGHGQSVSNVREIAAIMPFGAALAGRVLGARLLTARAWKLRLVPVLGVIAAGYLLALGYAAAQPPARSPYQALARWLGGHGLTDGLAGYWNANVTTLSGGGHVLVDCTWGRAPCTWETRGADYLPRSHRATFYILGNGADEASVERDFGQPRYVCRAAGFTVLVWDENMLTKLR